MSLLSVPIGAAYLATYIELRSEENASAPLWLFWAAVVIFAVGVIGAVVWFMTRPDDSSSRSGLKQSVLRGAGAQSDEGGAVAQNVQGSHNTTVAGNQFNFYSNQPTQAASGQTSPPTPSLFLSDPNVYHTPMYIAGQAQPMDKVDLWRIRLENLTPNTEAKTASVRVEKWSLAMRYGNYPLHRTGDDVPPFKQSFVVRYGEPIELDVIAMSPESGAVYLWRSDWPGYAFQLLEEEERQFREALEGRGIELTLRAVADNAEVEERAYLLRLDGGHLTMSAANHV